MLALIAATSEWCVIPDRIGGQKATPEGLTQYAVYLRAGLLTKSYRLRPS